MKKSALILGGLGIIVLSSCKKDFTCECANVPSAGETFNIPMNDMKKKDAKQACENAQTTYVIASPTASCALK